MSIDYSHVPATTPPLGVTANFEHPDSIAYQVIAISLSFTCTATFIVLLRLYTRFVVVRSPGLDDCGFLIYHKYLMTNSGEYSIHYHWISKAPQEYLTVGPHLFYLI